MGLISSRWAAPKSTFYLIRIAVLIPRESNQIEATALHNSCCKDNELCLLPLTHVEN